MLMLEQGTLCAVLQSTQLTNEFILGHPPCHECLLTAMSFPWKIAHENECIFCEWM